MHTQTHSCITFFIYTHAYAYTHTCTHIRRYTDIHTNTCMHIHPYIYHIHTPRGGHSYVCPCAAPRLSIRFACIGKRQLDMVLLIRLSVCRAAFVDSACVHCFANSAALRASPSMQNPAVRFEPSQPSLGWPPMGLRRKAGRPSGCAGAEADPSADAGADADAHRG